ncbi:MAG: sulfurtransferase-like selenium metabolism protein YedF [Thermodesulfovibrionales bacterium]
MLQWWAGEINQRQRLPEEEEVRTMVIDARGQGCPKPVVMATEALSLITGGFIEVVVDSEASADNLVWFAKSNALSSEKVRDGKDWRVKIVKGSAGVQSADTAEPKDTEKHLLLIISTDTMGKDEELGKILMKGYFETMKAYRQIPHTIVFLNAGVKLTTVNAEVLPVLKDIEAMGVEMYSCGTCLKYYGLESELKVGSRGTTNHVVEGMQDFHKTVWIG